MHRLEEFLFDKFGQVWHVEELRHVEQFKLHSNNSKKKEDR